MDKKTLFNQQKLSYYKNRPNHSRMFSHLLQSDPTEQLLGQFRDQEKAKSNQKLHSDNKENKSTPISRKVSKQELLVGNGFLGFDPSKNFKARI